MRRRSMLLAAGAAALAPLTTGTILVTFRTTSHNAAMTPISASDPGTPPLNLQGGALRFSARRQGTLLVERGHHRIALKMIKDLQIFDTGSRVYTLSLP